MYEKDEYWDDTGETAAVLRIRTPRLRFMIRHCGSTAFYLGTEWRLTLPHMWSSHGQSPTPALTMRLCKVQNAGKDPPEWDTSEYRAERVDLVQLSGGYFEKRRIRWKCGRIS
jgi:hypothetical protein